MKSKKEYRLRIGGVFTEDEAERLRTAFRTVSKETIGGSVQVEVEKPSPEFFTKEYTEIERIGEAIQTVLNDELSDQYCAESLRQAKVEVKHYRKAATRIEKLSQEFDHAVNALENAITDFIFDLRQDKGGKK